MQSGRPPMYGYNNVNNPAPDIGSSALSPIRGRWGNAATGALPSGAGGARRQETPYVEVEALVLVKIMKHCREHFPTPVNGLLLGLDGTMKLEVSDCFGLQNKRELWNQLSKERLDVKQVDDKVHLEYGRYQLKMLEQLNLVNADCLNVGWYQTLSFNDLKDPEIVDSLCLFQSSLPDAIVLGFDPQLATLGMDAFKAFRVTEPFLAKHRVADKSGDPSGYCRLRGQEVLVEVPVVVKNSLLIDAFVKDWIASDKDLQEAGTFDALESAEKAGGFFEKSLNFVCQCLDDVQAEQERLMKYQKDTVRQQQRQREAAERRRIENEQRRLRNEEPLGELSETVTGFIPPSQLPTMLMSTQVNRLSQKIGATVADSICRTMITRGQ